MSPAQRPPIAPLGSSISIIYAILLLAIFTIPITNSLIKPEKPTYNHNHAIYGILCFSLVIAFFFLLYLLMWLSWPHFSESHPVSHASAYVRCGAIFFGLGAIVFGFINKASDSDGHFWDQAHWSMVAAAAILICLQAIAVVLCARMKLDQGWGVDLGLMHLVATNLMIWMFAVVMESAHEAEEHGSHGDHDRANKSHDQVDQFGTVNNGTVINVEQISEKMFLPYLIEFSLIGATVFLKMWMEVGPIDEEEERKDWKNSLAIPKPVKYMKKMNTRETLWGFLIGCAILLINIVFVALWSHLHDDHLDEVVGKVLSCIVDGIGIAAILLGFYQTYNLPEKSLPANQSVDIYLLRMGVFFCFVFAGFLTSEGSAINTIVGLKSLVFVILQTLFIEMLIKKTVNNGLLPGRQVVTFLILENLGVWISYTFAMQNPDATTHEQSFFGKANWIVIQRITIPIIIFFRFHSSVLLVECWKMTYTPEEKATEMVAMSQLDTNNVENDGDQMLLKHNHDGELKETNSNLV